MHAKIYYINRDAANAASETLVNRESGSQKQRKKMDTSVFIFHDLKAKTFISPFFAANMHDALRSVKNILQKNGNLLADYPEDYVLYQTGVINHEDGRLIPLPDPILIQSLKSLKGGV